MTRWLRVTGVAAAGLSTIWIWLLLALAARCRLEAGPFPVLAKLSSHSEHWQWIDRALRLCPRLMLVAVLALAVACYRECGSRTGRRCAFATLVLLALTPLMAWLNPGGLVAWFLS